MYRWQLMDEPEPKPLGSKNIKLHFILGVLLCVLGFIIEPQAKWNVFWWTTFAALSILEWFCWIFGVLHLSSATFWSIRKLSRTFFATKPPVQYSQRTGAET